MLCCFLVSVGACCDADGLVNVADDDNAASQACAREVCRPGTWIAALFTTASNN